jgi:hypothetical protein
MVTILKKRKSKSAQYRFLSEYRDEFMQWLDLSRSTRNVLADSGYDSCDFGRRIEYDKKSFHTGRRFICPPNPRNQQGPKPQKLENLVQQHRQKRISFYLSPPGQQLYARRSQTVEPFNDWFKSLFELDERVWHYGLQNNQTQILAAIFCYQLLLRYNRRCGRKNGQIKWVLDTL